MVQSKYHKRRFFMKNTFSMTLNFDEYRDRVYACWIGKNIGGTMGAPYEGQRRTHDISGFATPPGKPNPNDDLDLQLIWLHAVEKMGPLAINAATLGEFWIGLLPANPNEYGIAKNNMRRGIIPPISGDYENMWKNSNGGWIRTEIWASLAPGCPALAAKYAIEDAKVDHGAGEGSIAAAFVAAMQSAAFVLKDIKACIEIGLATIPENSRMADSVRFLLDCHANGMSAMEARNAIFERNSDIGNGWFEAPSNVSYAIIGLLWGNGDFKKSVITAINCGDDTDCTGATAGATMGILGGASSIPNDWKAHIGDEIVTICINRGDHTSGGAVPKSCTELTERVTKQAPFVLFSNRANVSLTNEENNIPKDVTEQLISSCTRFRKELVFKPFTARYESTVLFADVCIEGGIDISPLEKKTVTVDISARRELGDDLINLTCRWWLPGGFSVAHGKQTAIVTSKEPTDPGITTMKFELVAGDTVSPVNRCVLEIMPEGRCTPLYASIVLLG